MSDFINKVSKLCPENQPNHAEISKLAKGEKIENLIFAAESIVEAKSPASRKWAKVFARAEIERRNAEAQDKRDADQRNANKKLTRYAGIYGVLGTLLGAMVTAIFAGK